MSLMKILKSNCLKAEPWGILRITSTQSLKNELVFFSSYKNLGNCVVPIDSFCRDHRPLTVQLVDQTNPDKSSSLC